MAALAYDYAGAANATGVSEATIRRAVARGEIFPRYPNSKPVFLATDLQEWLESLPVDKPVAS